MRTTVAFDEQLLRQLKQRAAEEGTTLQALINDLLRGALVSASHRRFKLRLQGWKATPHPGVDLADRDRLLELMDRR